MYKCKFPTICVLNIGRYSDELSHKRTGIHVNSYCVRIRERLFPTVQVNSEHRLVHV